MTITNWGSKENNGAVDLIMLDDIFPHQYSGFRFAEYRAYLEHFTESVVHSTGESIAYLGDKRKLEEVIEEFEVAHPHLRGRVVRFFKNCRPKARACYFVFLGNYRTFAETINQVRAPFVFTLYPGGSLRLYERSCNQLLRECFANPLFRRVLVTQPITREYLLKNNFVTEDQTVLIPGVVVPDEFLSDNGTEKRFFGQQKSTIDIAFIAHKYTRRGADKGYDTFVEMAHRLYRHRAKPRFHVIGGFQRGDIDVSKLNDHITFYGAVGTAELSRILSSIDFVVSPNVPGLSGVGLFDGFPTGAAVQAGLSGAAVFCTDELMQNRSFIDKKDLVIINSNARQIADCLSSYLDNMDELYKIAAAGRQTFRVHYGRDAQMAPRIRVLEELLKTVG